jgi:hypothetical protein
MTSRPVLASLAFFLVLAAVDAADAQQRRQRSAPSGELVTVRTDLPASCRVVDGFGASRTREFGAPATVRLTPRAADDTVVCVHDGKEGRAAIAPAARGVDVAVASATAAATPVRRFVAVEEVHPYPGRIALGAQAERELVQLRQRYEEGRLGEREYFRFRREVIARGAGGAS